MIRRWGAVEQMVSDGTLPTSEGRRLFAHSFEALTPAGDFSWSAYGTGTGAVFGVDTSQNPHAGKMIILNAGDLIGAFGDLNGSYGYASSTAALGLGDYGTAEALTIDATNGVRFLNSSGTAVLQMTGGLFYLSGEIRVGDTGTPGVDFNGIRIYKSGATYRVETQGAGAVGAWLNEDGLSLATGSGVINGVKWMYGATNAGLIRVSASDTTSWYRIYANPDNTLDDSHIYLHAYGGLGTPGIHIQSSSDWDTSNYTSLFTHNSALLTWEGTDVSAIGNLRLNGASFGSGKGVIAIKNCDTAPSTNPTGGGVQYCEGGALKYRGSSGTITTLAAA